MVRRAPRTPRKRRRQRLVLESFMYHETNWKYTPIEELPGPCNGEGCTRPDVDEDDIDRDTPRYKWREQVERERLDQ